MATSAWEAARLCRVRRRSRPQPLGRLVAQNHVDRLAREAELSSRFTSRSASCTTPGGFGHHGAAGRFGALAVAAWAVVDLRVLARED